MKLYQVDSFTTEKYKGNPAGVCLLEEFPSTLEMQSIAMEMNLSETAFVAIKDGQYFIRFFTPMIEVALCGHATLASAHILYEEGIIASGINFVFKATTTDINISRKDNLIALTFPIFELNRAELPARFNEVIGVDTKEFYQSSNNWSLALVGSEAEVLEASPNFEGIGKENLANLIVVTAKSESLKYDFVVRVFCNPAMGITEDPVTGSANCILMPFWSKKLNKTSLKSKQLSKRTGEMFLELKENSVVIMGNAITVFSLIMKAE